MMSPADEPRDFPDRIIRHQLENPDNLRELIAAVVPDLADGFDFSQVEFLSREFVLEDWRRRESDLLFRLPFRIGEQQHPVLVCVLIEHQSQHDPRMPLRMLLYTVLFWEREWKVWEESQPPRTQFHLTPVLPIVFHTGGQPWRTNRELRDLIGGHELLRAFAPKWQPLFWDLADRPVDSLLAASGEWERALAVVRAERDDPVAFRRVFEEAIRKLESLGNRDALRWRNLIEFMVRWALFRRPTEEEDALVETARQAQTAEALREELQDMVQTIAESLLARGKAEGKAEGTTEGRLGALRDTLRMLLEDQFGSLPASLRQRIEQADDPAALTAAIRQAPGLESLEQLHLPDSGP